LKDSRDKAEIKLKKDLKISNIDNLSSEEKTQLNQLMTTLFYNDNKNSNEMSFSLNNDDDEAIKTMSIV